MPITQMVRTQGGIVVPVDHLCGWGYWKSSTEFDYEATKDLQREQFSVFGVDPETFNIVEDKQDDLNPFKRLNIVGASPVTGGERMMLWEVGRKLFGQDTPNYPQEVGDCVSFGAKNGIEHVQFFPISNGASAEFKRIFPPYLYGIGRVLIGKGQLRPNQDGSLGVWQAKAVMQYGTVPIDAPGCPAYSGSIARKWGAPPGPPREFLDYGAKYLVKSAALVKTWADVVQALMNGYPVTIASNVGFDMTPRSDGFHHHSTQWGHQMVIIGAHNDPSNEYGCILNSWGDVHGQVKDFVTGEIWPKGTLRVLRKDIEKILREGDSFAYSQFDGFPTQELSRNDFNIF